MSKSETRAKNKYNSKSYERISLFVRMGQKDLIKSYVESKGESLNSYINRLIAEDMRAHGQSLSTDSTDNNS